MLKKLIATYCTGLLFAAVGAGFLVVGALAWIYFSLPSKEEIRSCFVTTMHEVKLCSTDINYSHLRTLPRHLIDILLLSEDASFWSHNGFDLDEIKKSIEDNVEVGQYKRGASTISQQLAKNMFLTPEKSLFRKFREALITIRIESYLSKREILEKYLNLVEFGPRVFGIKAASHFYFSKNPSELLPEESAFLVMLLPNPKKYSQSFFQKGLTRYAFSRINTLLKRAYHSGKLPEDQYLEAKYRTQSLFNSNIPVWDESEVSSQELDSGGLKQENYETESRDFKPLEVQDQTGTKY